MKNINKKQVPEAPKSKKIYEIIKGKEKTWAIGIEEYSHEIYALHGDPKGMGGSEVLFKQKDGTEYKAKGVWHSNPDSLFHDTGIDLRKRTLSFGFISLERKNIGMLLDSYEDLVYCDKQWKVGLYKRIENKACELANKLNKKVYYYSETLGGSTSHVKEPNIKEYLDLIMENVIYESKFKLEKTKTPKYCFTFNREVYLYSEIRTVEGRHCVTLSLRGVGCESKNEITPFNVDLELRKDIMKYILIVKKFLNDNLDLYSHLLEKDEKISLLNELL